ncbi:MAG: hypothetical protein ACI9XO_002338 [Paraglaciecola sp.]|jgi:hypothetical protein
MQFKEIGLYFLFSIFLSTFAIGQNDEGFAFEAEETHYILITMTDNAVDIPDVRAEVTKYVWRNHAAAKLKITHILIGESRSTNAIILEAFTDKNNAMNFYEKMQTNRPDFMQMDLTKEYLAISKSNYNQILRNESMDGYTAFFKEKYLR